MTGIERIAAERARQVAVEGWTPEHDAEHTDYSLALAAVCYAAPTRLYEKIETAERVIFTDPWPDSWDGHWDRRFKTAHARKEGGNVPPDPDTYTREEYIDLLTKGGALLAAELDRLLAS